MSADRVVRGNCPMGCGSTLFLADGGYITCMYVECPYPTAVSDLLEERETEHVVVFVDGGKFTIKHPLRERVEDTTQEADLWRCLLHAYLSELDGPPVRPGRYRATAVGLADVRWKWEALP